MTQPAEGINLGGIVSTLRTADTYRPELVMARGPITMGEPADGSYAALFSSSWALAWTQAAGLQLYQQQGLNWVQVAPGQAFPAMPEDARHVSLAFDQSARHVVAWEVDGQISVRQWDNAQQLYAYVEPFSGVDPLVLNDATVMYHAPDSDVLLLYLNAARDTIYYRLQRDSYSIERTLLTGLTAAVLDQAVALPYKLEVFGESAGLPFAVITTFYPVRASDRMAGSGAFTEGISELMLFEKNSSDLMTGGGHFITSEMEIQETIFTVPDRMTGTGAMTGGTSEDSLIARAPAPDRVTGTGTLKTGAYDDIGIPRTLTERITGTGQFTGGTYGP